MARGAASRISAHSLKNTTVDYQPLAGFRERAPGVWIPDGYRPTKYELPAPMVRDPEEAAQEYLRCMNSLPHFAFRQAWSLHTDDPAGIPVYRKVPIYPYLISFFRQVEHPVNIHVEKSRQLLMSWAWMVVFLWDILFHDGWANLAISRKEALVDDGAAHATTDSLFGKLKVVWQGLPPYLQHPMHFKHLRVTCLETGSYVKGESASSSGGRGATYKRALIDEAAFIPNSEGLFRAVHEAAKKGLALNSTPMGKANMFARIRFQPRTSFRRITFHWSMHPDKVKGVYCQCGWQSDPNQAHLRQQFADHVCLRSKDPSEKIERKPRSPWYDAATQDYTPEQIASEFDLSYEKSMRGRVFEPFDTTRHVFHYDNPEDIRARRIHLFKVHDNEPVKSKPQRERYLRAMLKRNLETVIGWDFGISDPTSLCLGQVYDEANMGIRWLDEYEHTNQSWMHYRKFVNGLWAPLVKEVTGFDALHYCDPSGRNRGADLTSWVSNLGSPADESDRERLGPPIIIKWGPIVKSPLPWLELISDLMRRNHFDVSVWNEHMCDALSQYHFPLDAEGNPVPGEHLPVHDQWSHMMSAMRYVYAIRWHTRLKDVKGTQVTASQIFEMLEQDSIERPPMF